MPDDAPNAAARSDVEVLVDLLLRLEARDSDDRSAGGREGTRQDGPVKEEGPPTPRRSDGVEGPASGLDSFGTGEGASSGDEGSVERDRRDTAEGSSSSGGGDSLAEPEATSAGVSAARSEERPGGVPGLHVDVEAVDRITYAHVHNRVAIVRGLGVRTDPGGPTGTLTIDVELTWQREATPPSTPLRFTISAPPPGQPTLRVEDVNLRLDDAVMVDLEESVPATLRITISTDDGGATVEERDVRIMARNQWYFGYDYGDSLAAFVQPNHPAVRDVLEDASKRLATTTGSGALEGYQAGPERAYAIGQKIFEALQARGIGYVNPPASFEENQKVRPIDEVLESGRGTCIDLACAYAACLEQAGLHPLIWIVPGHAFAGFLVDEQYALPQAAVWDPNTILSLRDAKVAVPVETVGLTDGSSFAGAVAATHARFTTTSFGVDAPGLVIDVLRAHRGGTLPLPARVQRDGVTTVVVDSGPGRPTLVERRDTQTKALLDNEAPMRVRSWQTSLLDLSLRNPLVNFTPRRAALDLLVGPGLLGRIEDDLAAGRDLTLQPADVLEGAETAAGLRDVTQVNDEALTNLYERLSLLYTTSGEKEGAAKVRRLVSKARIQEGETGANNLYLVLGTLRWTLGGRELRSPLYLVPVRMTRTRGQGLASISIDETGYALPNYALAEKLRNELDVDVPEYEQPEEDESGVDVKGGLNALRKALLRRGDTAIIDETAHLALLSFSSFRLWKDMRDHWRTFLENPVVRHLVHHPGHPFEDPKGDVPADADEVNVHAPIPLDGTQLRAVARAASGHSFVIEGPPGTGKSQTITNLLAHAMASGKRVLFVAEKQAALSVVKQRIDAIGLGAYCLDLHDKGSSPKEIRSQLGFSLEHAPDVEEDDVRRTHAALSTVHERLDAYADALYATNEGDRSYAGAHRALLELRDAPHADVPPAIARAPKSTVIELEDALRNVSVAMVSARPSVRHPWRFAGLSDFDALDREALQETVDRLGELAEGWAAVGGPLRALVDGCTTPESLREAAPLVEAAENGTLPPRAFLDSLVDDDWMASFREHVAALRARLETYAGPMATLGVEPFKFAPSDVEARVARVREAAASFPVGRRRRTRDALRQVHGHVPDGLTPREAVAEAERHLERVRRLHADREWLQNQPHLTVEGEDLFVETDLAVLERRVDAWRAHASYLVGGEQAEAAMRVYADASSVPEGSSVRMRAFADALEAFLGAVRTSPPAFEAWLEGRNVADAIQSTSEAWRKDAQDARFPQLRRWAGLLADLRPVRDVGLVALSDDVLDGVIDAEDVERAFMRGYYASVVREREEALDLDAFDARRHDQAVRRFVDLNDTRKDQLRDVIPARLMERRRFDAASEHGAVAQLKKQLHAKRGAKSVRNLIATYPDLIQQVTPCFLMSPDSVAKFLPPGRIHFDLVVFDEASQIDLAESIGVMGRADAVVVVGDSKQMPPTRFGTASGGHDDPLSDVVDDAEEPIEDGESLLVEAVEAGLSREWLAWHYRSRDESLIAFSNARYYDQRLASFPSPRTGVGQAVNWRKVEGQYEHGGRRINEREAVAIVEEVERRVDDAGAATPSIGIVTFNTQQRDEIQRRLEASDNASIRGLLDEEGERGLFVRNLEAVQGHERDVILFSVGFSKRADGSKMPLQFGPLNREGGERRLNVAITRAREEVLLFTSFEPEEIEEARTSALGLLHLREFLMAAKYGMDASGLTSEADGRHDAHVEDVREALEMRGLHVRENVGRSRFKIDLVVAESEEDPDPVAVLLDGPEWASRPTVGDRDGLPATVLQGVMGWKSVARVWLPAWRTERESVLTTLEQLVRHRDRGDGREAPSGSHPGDRTAGPDTQSARSEPSESVDRADAPPNEPSGAVRWTPDHGAAYARELLDVLAGGGDGSRHGEDGEADLEATAEAAPGAAAPGAASAATASDRPVRTTTYTPWPTNAPRFGADLWPEPDQLTGQVYEVAKEVVDAEGPLSLERLAKVVAHDFDIRRVSAQRVEGLRRMLVGRSAAAAPSERYDVRVGAFGTYVWPPGVDPERYDVLRRVPRDVTRPLDEVAPEEVIGAMRVIAQDAHSIERDALPRALAGEYNIKRVTKGIEQRLKAILDLGIRQGRLAEREGFIVAPAERDDVG